MKGNDTWSGSCLLLKYYIKLKIIAVLVKHAKAFLSAKYFCPSPLFAVKGMCLLTLKGNNTWVGFCLTLKYYIKLKIIAAPVKYAKVFPSGKYFCPSLLFEAKHMCLVSTHTEGLALAFPSNIILS